MIYRWCGHIEISYISLKSFPCAIINEIVNVIPIEYVEILFFFLFFSIDQITYRSLYLVKMGAVIPAFFRGHHTTDFEIGTNKYRSLGRRSKKGSRKSKFSSISYQRINSRCYLISDSSRWPPYSIEQRWWANVTGSGRCQSLSVSFSEKQRNSSLNDFHVIIFKMKSFVNSKFQM